MWCGPKVDLQPAEPGEIVSVIERSEIVVDVPPHPLALRWAMSLARGVETLHRTILLNWLERPALIRTVAVLLLVVFGAVMFLTQKPAGAGFVQDIYNAIPAQYQRGALMDDALNLAEQIYLALLFLTLMYNLVNSYIQYNSMRGFFMVVYRTALVGYLPLVLIRLLHMCFDPNALNYGMSLPGVTRGPNFLQDQGISIAQKILGPLGAGANAQPMTTLPSAFAASASAFMTALFKYALWGHLLSPFNVAIYGGLKLAGIGALFLPGATKLLALIPFGTLGNYWFFLNLALFLIMLAIGLIVSGCLLMIALEIVIVNLEVLLLLPLTVWTLGFLGSPATANMGSGVWQVLLKTVIRYVVIYVLGYMAYHLVGSPPTSGTPATWAVNTQVPVAGATGWIADLFKLTNWSDWKPLASLANTPPFNLLPQAARTDLMNLPVDIKVPPHYGPFDALTTIFGHGFAAILLLILILRLPHIAANALTGNATFHSSSQMMHASTGTVLGAATGGLQGAAYGGGGLGAVAGGLMGAYTGAHQGPVSGVANVASTYSSRRNSAQSKVESTAEKEIARKRHLENLEATKNTRGAGGQADTPTPGKDVPPV